MPRVALGLEYNGAFFCGWQSQADGNGIQDIIQQAITPINGGIVNVCSAGRTDSGVHASLQIAHFDALLERPDSVWARALNARLPRTIRVLWARAVSPKFHARYLAQRRYYQYILLNRDYSSALLDGLSGYHKYPLALAPMQEAASRLLGKRDFSVFRISSCQAKTPVRTLFNASVRQIDDIFIFDFCADGFLHRMARNMVSALLKVGGGRAPEWIDETLKQKQLRLPSAAASGLYFVGVDYPSFISLPQSRRSALNLLPLNIGE